MPAKAAANGTTAAFELRENDKVLFLGNRRRPLLSALAGTCGITAPGAAEIASEPLIDQNYDIFQNLTRVTV